MGTGIVYMELYSPSYLYILVDGNVVLEQNTLISGKQAQLQLPYGTHFISVSYVIGDDFPDVRMESDKIQITLSETMPSVWLKVSRPLLYKPKLKIVHV